VVGGHSAGGDPALRAVIALGDCTAVLVSPRALVTSAHCVAPHLDHATIAGHSLAIEACERAPLYNGTPADDIAVCRLSEAAPVAPLALDDAPALAVGDAVTLLGFGRTGPLAHDGVLLRAVETVVSGASSGSAGLQAGAAEATACSGDSGGPVIVRRGGELRVAAIIQGPTGAICASAALAVPVGAHRVWLDHAMGADVRAATPSSAGAAAVVTAIAALLVVLGAMRRRRR
jgi:hypothetical protein